MADEEDEEEGKLDEAALVAALLFNSLIRHQLFLEGVKKWFFYRFSLTLAQVETVFLDTMNALPVERMGELTKPQLGSLLIDLKSSMWKVLNPSIAETADNLKVLVDTDRSLFIDIYSATAKKPKEVLAIAPKPEKIYAKAITAPMGANGISPEKFIQTSRAAYVVNVENAIKQARANNDTKKELIDKVVGTKAANKKDGIIKKTANQTKAVENTVIQHVSAQTNATIAKKIAGEYEWVSVLDDKTTPICNSRDGKRFPYGEGPLPPAHVNCRSTVLPVGVSTGSVDYLDTFAKWAKAQPDTVLKDIFGDDKPDPANAKPLTPTQLKRKSKTILTPK